MATIDTFEKIRDRALSDSAFRKNLLASRTSPQPLSTFCGTCRENGYEIYEMELIALGEDDYAAMKRSTNGGGENSPVLNAQNDYYELLMLELEKLP